MGVATDFAIRPLADTAHDYQMQLKSHANAAEVNLADLGFGVSQLLPVIDDGFIILGEYQNKTRINPPRAPGVVVALLRAGCACCWCGGFVAGELRVLLVGVSVGAGHARDCGFAASKAFASTALVIAQLQINSIPKRIIANTINEFCSQRVGDNIACGCLYLFFTTNGTIVVTAAPDIFLIASFTHGSRRRRLHCANQ